IAFTLNGNSVGSATSNGSGVATLNNVSLSGINAGTYASGVGASFAGDSGFAAANGSASLTVNKATPTATLGVTNSPQPYNGSGQSALVSVTTSSVPGAVQNVLTGGATTKTNAGTYAVTADFVPNDTTNYKTLTGLPAGDFVIQQATPTSTVAVTTTLPTNYDADSQTAAGMRTSSVNGPMGDTSAAADATTG